MEVDYTGEQEKTIEDLIGEGAPTLRLQPMIYDTTSRNYRAWRNVSWTLKCENVEEAKALRDAMQSFFSRVQELGAAAVVEALAGMEKA